MAGCSRPSGNVTSARDISAGGLPAGWTRVQSSGSEVSIGLPPHWHERDMSQAELSKNMANSAQRNPGLATGADAARKMAAEHEFKLMFVREKMPGQAYSPNGNVLVLRIGNLTVAEYVQAAAQAMTDSGASNVEVSDVAVPSGRVKVLQYHRPFTYGGVTTDVEHRNYYFEANGQLYMLGFALPPGTGELDDEVLAMVKSFQFGAK